MLLRVYFVSLIAYTLADARKQKPNVLLIIVDDLRTALGCYGDKMAHTPNIDLLAAGAAVFTQAFAQQALCAPSRNSFLTSRRPDTLQLYDFYSYWRKAIGNFTTLPQHFKNNGYITKSVGKVFHPGISSNNSDDSPYSWTEKPFHPYTNKYKDAAVCKSRSRAAPAKNLVCPVRVRSMPNNTLPDIEILKEAKRFIRKHVQYRKPFFLAVGFQKPHIPLKYPAKYLKYHPLHKFNLTDPYAWPANISSIAYNPWIDIRKRDDVRSLNLEFPWEKIPANFARGIIQSYYAAVTYIDDLIGKLLKQLDQSSIRQDTMIILMSDHGWSLGEHAVWAKYSNFDVAVRVPLIMSIPWLTFQKKNQSSSYSKLNLNDGMVINELVELVDIFPSIAELANIPVTLCLKEKIEITCSEGTSLVPLITAASTENIAWKTAAFGQYPRPGILPTLEPNSDEPHFKQITTMGYTVRTSRYRYTTWLPFKPNTHPEWDKIIAEELYDHNSDEAEQRNVALTNTYSIVKNKLRNILRRGWRNALPETISRN